MKDIATASNDVLPWTSFAVRLQAGKFTSNRGLQGLTDGELRWVLQGALAEVERRKAVRSLHRKLSVTDA